MAKVTHSHPSKTNSNSPSKVHMSVTNSDTCKSSSCQTNTSKPSTSKTDDSIAKVDMPSGTKQSKARTCNQPTLEWSRSTSQGEKLSITVSL